MADISKGKKTRRTSRVTYKPNGTNHVTFYGDNPSGAAPSGAHTVAEACVDSAMDKALGRNVGPAVLGTGTDSRAATTPRTRPGIPGPNDAGHLGAGRADTSPITAGHEASSPGSNLSPAERYGSPKDLAYGHGNLRQGATTPHALFTAALGKPTYAQFDGPVSVTVEEMDLRDAAGSFQGMNTVNPSPLTHNGDRGSARNSATAPNPSMPRYDDTRGAVSQNPQACKSRLEIMKETMRRAG